MQNKSIIEIKQLVNDTDKLNWFILINSERKCEILHTDRGKIKGDICKKTLFYLTNTLCYSSPLLRNARG